LAVHKRNPLLNRRVVGHKLRKGKKGIKLNMSGLRPMRGDKLRVKVKATPKSDGKQRFEIKAELVKITRNGICFAVDAKQRTFAFRLSKIAEYSGEDPADLGFVEGQEVEISVKNGDVVSVAQPA
jgi:hypothetical protein